MGVLLHASAVDSALVAGVASSAGPVPPSPDPRHPQPGREEERSSSVVTAAPLHHPAPALAGGGMSSSGRHSSPAPSDSAPSPAVGNTVADVSGTPSQAGPAMPPSPDSAQAPSAVVPAQQPPSIEPPHPAVPEVSTAAGGASADGGVVVVPADHGDAPQQPRARPPPLDAPAVTPPPSAVFLATAPPFAQDASLPMASGGVSSVPMNHPVPVYYGSPTGFPTQFYQAGGLASAGAAGPMMPVYPTTAVSGPAMAVNVAGSSAPVSPLGAVHDPTLGPMPTLSWPYGLMAPSPEPGMGTVQAGGAVPQFQAPPQQYPAAVQYAQYAMANPAMGSHPAMVFAPAPAHHNPLGYPPMFFHPAPPMQHPAGAAQHYPQQQAVFHPQGSGGSQPPQRQRHASSRHSSSSSSAGSGSGPGARRSGRGSRRPSLPANYSPRPGDWFCPACNNLNFKSRTACNMRNCRYPRDGDFSGVRVVPVQQATAAHSPRGAHGSGDAPPIGRDVSAMLAGMSLQVGAGTEAGEPPHTS